MLVILFLNLLKQNNIYGILYNYFFVFNIYLSKTWKIHKYIIILRNALNFKMKVKTC